MYGLHWLLKLLLRKESGICEPDFMRCHSYMMTSFATSCEKSY